MISISQRLMSLFRPDKSSFLLKCPDIRGTTAWHKEMFHESRTARPPDPDHQLLGRGQFDPLDGTHDRDAPRHDLPLAGRGRGWLRAAHGPANARSPLPPDR